MNKKTGKAITLTVAVPPEKAGEAVDSQTGALLQIAKQVATKSKKELGNVTVSIQLPSTASAPKTASAAGAPEKKRANEEVKTPAPVQETKKDCGIAQLKLRCQHGVKKREPGPGKTLQIVPEPDLKKQIGREALKEKEVGKETFSLEFSCSAKTGGHDTLTVEVAVVDEKAAKRKQFAVLKKPDDPLEKDWKDNSFPREVRLEPPTAKPIWLANFQPDNYWVYGRGCDDTVHSAHVEVFPSNEYEFNFNLKAFEVLAKKIQKKLDGTCSKQFGDVTLNARFEGPEGSLSGKCSWQENEDWRVYYGARFEAEAKLFGIGIGAKWNIRDTAIRLGLSAIGVPPPLADLLIKLKNEYAEARSSADLDPPDPLDYLMQLYMDLSLMGAPKIVGKAGWRMFYDEDNFNGYGELKAVGEVRLKLLLSGQLGHEKLWNYVKLEGEASVGVDFEFELQVEKNGVFIAPKITHPGILLKITAATMTMKIKGSAEGSFRALEPGQFYPDPEDEHPSRWTLIDGKS
jgi:hypothetical protein